MTQLCHRGQNPNVSPGESQLRLQAMDVVHYLRALPEERVQSLLDAIAVERPKFAYRTSLQNTPSASSIIVSKMCSLAGSSSGTDDARASDIDTA